MGIFCTIESPDYMDTAIMVLESSQLLSSTKKRVTGRSGIKGTCIRTHSSKGSSVYKTSASVVCIRQIILTLSFPSGESECKTEDLSFVVLRCSSLPQGEIVITFNRIEPPKGRSMDIGEYQDACA